MNYNHIDTAQVTYTKITCFFRRRFIFMGNDGTYEDGNSSIRPGGTAIKLNKDVEFKVNEMR